MPLSATSTGGQLPSKRGSGGGESCASCKADDFLRLMEPDSLASRGPDVSEGGLAVCFVTGHPEQEARKGKLAADWQQVGVESA